MKFSMICKICAFTLNCQNVSVHKMAFSEEAEVKCYRRSQGNIYKPMVTNGNIVSKKAFLSKFLVI